MNWETVNYYQNSFSEDVGNVLFGEKQAEGRLNLSSPDSTTDGNLKKRWRIIENKHYLVKGGSTPYRQQPFNEVIATNIMEQLNILHVSYTMTWDHDVPYSLCEDFVTEDTELVPAWRIYQVRKKQNNTSVYRHFVDYAETLRIPQVIPFLDRMIVLDYLIANEDRHLNNFGAIRNAETLKWIGMAPIYDSGSSLGYDTLASGIRSGRNIPCKPFKKTHEEQLGLVHDFSWINFTALSNVKEMILDIFSSEEAKNFMEESRKMAIADSVERRIQFLMKYSQTEQRSSTDTTAGDVTKNIAKSY